MNWSTWNPLAECSREKGVLHFRDLFSSPVPSSRFRAVFFKYKNTTRSFLTDIFAAFQSI